MSPPLPPADLVKRDFRLRILPKGTVLHRFFNAADAPIYFDRSLRGRLNSPDGAYGVLYAALGLRGAFVETFLREPGLRQIDPKLLARKAYVRLEVLRDLKLIDLVGPGLAVIGATAEIVHGGLPYAAPQAWSVALYWHPIAADGIAYHARHDDQALCVALFERGEPFVGQRDRMLDLDADWFWKVAEVYGRGSPPR